MTLLKLYFVLVTLSIPCNLISNLKISRETVYKNGFYAFYKVGANEWLDRLSWRHWPIMNICIEIVVSENMVCSSYPLERIHHSSTLFLVRSFHRSLFCHWSSNLTKWRLWLILTRIRPCFENHSNKHSNDIFHEIHKTFPICLPKHKKNGLRIETFFMVSFI